MIKISFNIIFLPIIHLFDLIISYSCLIVGPAKPVYVRFLLYIIILNNGGNIYVNYSINTRLCLQYWENYDYGDPEKREKNYGYNWLGITGSK